MTVPEYVAHARELVVCMCSHPRGNHHADRQGRCYGRTSDNTQCLCGNYAPHDDLVPRLCAVVEAQRSAMIEAATCATIGADGEWSQDPHTPCWCALHAADCSNNEHESGCVILRTVFAQPIDAFTTEDV